MSSSAEQAAIRVERAGKFYPPRLSPARLMRYLWPKPLTPKPVDFWALRDVSFELERGQVLGVIGRNGSGKSTLLQMVAGLLVPSEGRIEARGVTSALLELGAGFNPEFTGRENIFLSGAVYGFSRAMMEKKYDDIVSFADIGPHLDQPVKTYSTGMFARLAFAVAIQVDPDILLVDEILSVGDLGFQAKCFRRIEALRQKGTSILFVSHDLNSIQMLCDKAILLDDGRLVAAGAPNEITNTYIGLLSRRGQPAPTAGGAADTKLRAELSDVRLLNAKGEATVHPRSGEKCRILYRVRFNDDMSEPVVSLQLKTMLGIVVYDQTSLFLNRRLPPCRKDDALDVVFDLTLNLCPGPFRVCAGIAEVRGEAPVPVSGNEDLAIEVISDRRAHGIALLNAELSFEHAKGARESHE